MTRKYFAVMMALSVVLLAGCWDKVELESRGFVISIGIDKYRQGDEAAVFSDARRSNRYLVAMALPNLGAMLEKADEEKSKTVKVAANETVSAAMRLIDSYSSQKLYFGQAKAIVLGEELLTDDSLLRGAMDALERNREISRKAIVLASRDNVRDVMGANISGEPLMGMFVSEFYKNNSKVVAIAFKQDLQGMIQRLSFNGDTLIPQISLESDENQVEIKLGGAAVIKDFKLAGWLDDRQTRGYLWCMGEAEGAQVVAPLDATFVPLRVNKSSADIRFIESGGRLVCQIDASVHGTVEEFLFADSSMSDELKLELLRDAYNNIISQEIVDVFGLFQKEYAVDALGLQESLRKEEYSLYMKRLEDFDRAFAEMELVVNVDVRITSTGVIK